MSNKGFQRKHRGYPNGQGNLILTGPSLKILKINKLFGLLMDDFKGLYSLYELRRAIENFILSLPKLLLTVVFSKLNFNLLIHNEVNQSK